MHCLEPLGRRETRKGLLLLMVAGIRDAGRRRRGGKGRGEHERTGNGHGGGSGRYDRREGGGGY